jgi:hypothetical protein
MQESSNFINDLEILSRILIRCFIIGIVLMTCWFVFFIFGSDSGYAMHARLFQISRHEYDLLNYYGMAFIKGCNILLFLIPYIAIRMVLGQRKT